MKNKWIQWWQSLPATDRFPLMRKYGVKQVTDKLIKRMWLGEGFLECGNPNPPCYPNLKYGVLECAECNWSEI